MKINVQHGEGSDFVATCKWLCGSFLVAAMLGGIVVYAVEHTKEVTITAQPRFETPHHVSYLLLTNDKSSYRLAWASSDVQFVPVTLDTNRVYVFTIGQRPNRSIAIPELHRVQQDGKTIYDIEVCEVHKIKMEHKEVRISYGLVLPGPDAPTPDTERQLFPHQREYSLGGCVVMSDSPKTERVYVCTGCKKAYEKWKRETKKEKSSTLTLGGEAIDFRCERRPRERCFWGYGRLRVGVRLGVGRVHFQGTS